MKTIKFFTYAVFVLFLGVAMSSCKGDDGADGIDGIDGAAGPAGQDGNANVQTLTYDISNESGYGITTTIPEFTQEVLENDAILFYLKTYNNVFYAIPGSLINFQALVSSSVGTNLIFFQDWDGNATSITTGFFTLLKIVIIESNGKSAGSNSQQQEIYTELKNAGVNINDYYEVCDYYGITP